MATQWIRSIQAANGNGRTWISVANLTAGSAIIRNRIRWGFYADTSNLVDAAFVAQNVFTFGLVTTVGNGTEIPPDPRTGAFDADPPTQRWIYWECRAPVVSSWDSSGGVVAWRDSGATEETQTKGQVLATGLPGGDTLNLWATWNSPYSWDSSGSVTMWYGISTLLHTP
jgi:hypothetical protein